MATKFSKCWKLAFIGEERITEREKERKREGDGLEKQGEKDGGKEGEKGRINEIEILFKDGKQI